MLKKILATSLLASTFVTGSALADDWSFTYTGFLHQESGTWNPNYQITGNFSGTDQNHNGFIDRDEVSAFSANGNDYIGCADASNFYWHCGLNGFSYRLGGALTFDAGQSGRDPEWISFSASGHTSNGYYEYRSVLSDSYSMNMVRTAATQLAISGPVPEPETYAMLGMGLLALAGMHARRRRTSANT